VALSDTVLQKHSSLKRFLNDNLYRHDSVRKMTDEARLMIEALFDRYTSDPSQMPREFSTRASGPDGTERVVADYIAGMTDRFAISEYQRLSS
jgi:dGTPase